MASTRRIAFFVAAGLALAAVLWGLVRLQAIFIDERDDALRGIAEQQAALSGYAQQEVMQALAGRLSSAQKSIELAEQDPLVAARSLYLFEQGEQRLPRRDAPRSGTQAEAMALLGALERDAVSVLAEAEPGSPWAERLELYTSLSEALAVGDRAAIEGRFRDILGHRARFVIATELDVPFTIAALSRLASESQPAPSLMRGLLRDGLQGGTANLPGLQRQLLRHRARFTQADLEGLAARIVALGANARVLHTDFDERVRQPPSEVLAIDARLGEPTLALGGQWYVEPATGGRLAGVAVNVAATLDETAVRMRERALLREGDEVVVDGELGASTPMTALRLRVDSPRWGPAMQAVESRYRLKAWLLVAVAALLMGSVALGYVIYRRRHRFIELKGQFVSAVSHELRTPLASIRLMAETLERRTKEVPRTRDYATRIIRDIDGLSFLVENILSFSRLSRGRWVPRRARVDLAELWKKVADDRDSWARKPAELTVDGLDGASVYADPDLLQLVFTNLARNACQYHERDVAHIEVSGERVDRGWLLRVRDDGIGVPRGETERIFDEFHRGQDRSERGSGLGLAICRRVMEAHGGGIRVAETGPGGTTFEIALPDASEGMA